MVITTKSTHYVHIIVTFSCNIVVVITHKIIETMKMSLYGMLLLQIAMRQHFKHDEK